MSYLATRQGGFGTYVRTFVNYDGKEVIVYRHGLGYATAFRDDVMLLAAGYERIGIELANKWWDSIGLDLPRLKA